MKKQDLVNLILNDITASGALKIPISEKEIERIINVEMEVLYRIYRDLLEPQYTILNAHYFKGPEFKANRAIQFPDCIVGVNQLREIRGGSRVLGFTDPDLGFSKALMGDLYLTPWSSDTVAYRTIQWSTWDLMRSFQLSGIQFDFNQNTHRVVIKGRTPYSDVFVDAISKIPAESAYEDPWVRRWLIAKAKIQAGRIMGLYQGTLLGGATINHTMLTSEGENEITKIETYFKEINSPDYFIMTN